MAVRRLVVAAGIGVAVAGLLSNGSAVASARPGTPVPASGWAAVPAAARGPVMSAVDRDQAAVAVPALRSTELLSPHPKTDQEFGSSVAVSADLLVIGVPYETNSGAGAAYVFQRPDSGWADVHQVATLEYSNHMPGDQFGEAVAISGRTIVVSAPGESIGTQASQGAVDVFVEPAGGWSGTRHQAAELMASDGVADDSLGYRAVAVSGKTVVAASANHQVGMNADQGEVYVWTEPRAGWSGIRQQSAKLAITNGAAGDDLGYGAVGVSGNTVIAGSGYRQVGSDSEQGAVYVFVRPKSGWSGRSHQSAELVSSDGAAFDELGLLAAGISGKTVVAAAAGHEVGGHSAQGAAYVWVQPESGWSGTRRQAAELVASDGATNDYLGDYGIAVSGGTVAVAASLAPVGTQSEQGKIYSFTEPTHGWSGTRIQSTESTAPDGVAGDYLGADSVGVFGTTVVAGAPSHAVATMTNAGAGYVFAPSRPTLTGLKEAAHAWRLGSRATHLNPVHKPKAGGTRFSFALAQAGSVTLRFVKKGHHKAAGVVSVNARHGHSALYFFGRLTAHKLLSPGSYTVSFVTANTAGTSSKHMLHFEVLRH